MSIHDHTLSPGCWCDPVIAHVEGNRLVVDTEEDLARLAELGVRDAVVRPRPGKEPLVGGENGNQ